MKLRVLNAQTGVEEIVDVEDNSPEYRAALAAMEPFKEQLAIVAGSAVPAIVISRGHGPVTVRIVEDDAGVVGVQALHVGDCVMTNEDAVEGSCNCDAIERAMDTEENPRDHLARGGGRTLEDVLQAEILDRLRGPCVCGGSKNDPCKFCRAIDV